MIKLVLVPIWSVLELGIVVLRFGGLPGLALQLLYYNVVGGKVKVWVGDCNLAYAEQCKACY